MEFVSKRFKPELQDDRCESRTSRKTFYLPTPPFASNLHIEDEEKEMKHASVFEHDVFEQADAGIVMPDGVRLSARIWMPENAEESPVPAILEYIPYRKRDGTVVRDEISHPWMAGQGYACIRVDIRGNGESDGLMLDEYTQEELDDACHVIAWLREQPWCDGNVGMTGISWGGFNCLQVAAMQPPGLKAVIANCATVDRYADDIHYKGGCLMGENFGWASQMLSYSSRPPDPALVGDQNWLEMWRHRLENLPWLWSEWHRHQHRDAFWEHGSVCEDYSAIKAAVLSINGWHDGYRNTVSHLVTNVAAPVKGIIGPWIHKYPHYAGPGPTIGYLQEARRWWDRWLKGENTNVENDPDMRMWLMDSVAPKRWHDERPGRWIIEQEWPSTHIEAQTLHLAGSGLSDQPAKIDARVSSPQHCGLAGGEYFPFTFAEEFPDEQSSDDALSVCFDGIATTQPIDIVGAPTLKLKLACDTPEALVCVRLCDLRPDGTSAFITYGILNLAHARSHANPEKLSAGNAFEIDLALDQIAYHLPAGHRLRVAISNAYWPFVWPSPTAGSLQLFSGSLSLPVRPLSTGQEWEFEEAEGSPAWEHEVLRPSTYSRTESIEEATGEAVVLIDCDNGENRDAAHGLVSGSWTHERWSIHPQDPLSAMCEIEWEQTGGREGQMWRTEVTAKMWCDAENFFSTASIRCWLENDVFFEQDYRDSVARNLV